MSGSFPRRIVGAHGNIRATLHAMAHAGGVSPTSGVLDEAVDVTMPGPSGYADRERAGWTPSDTFRRRGFRTGLLSDCSSERCEVWAGSR